MNSYAYRLKAAREATRITQEQIAQRTGINVPSYYDLESVDAELFTAISLRELKMLCEVLNIEPSNLFSDKAVSASEKVSKEDLVRRIKEHLHQKRINIEQFENTVGFQIKDCLERPDAILDWNVDCLRFVCNELGVEWIKALP